MTKERVSEWTVFFLLPSAIEWVVGYFRFQIRETWEEGFDN